MSRLILFALLAATLAACSEAGPYGYGYAVNGRLSLSQLSAGPSDPGTPFHTRPPADSVTADAE
jgi:hypothetical protein